MNDLSKLFKPPSEEMHQLAREASERMRLRESGDVHEWAAALAEALVAAGESEYGPDYRG